MWSGVLWFALLTAAMLCYPRRPRTAGVLWVVLGMLSLFLRYLHNPGNLLGSVSGAFFVILGVTYLFKYRRPDVRAKHVEYWTAKA